MERPGPDSGFWVPGESVNSSWAQPTPSLSTLCRLACLKHSRCIPSLSNSDSRFSGIVRVLFLNRCGLSLWTEFEQRVILGTKNMPFYEHIIWGQNLYFFCLRLSGIPSRGHSIEKFPAYRGNSAPKSVGLADLVTIWWNFGNCPSKTKFSFLGYQE